MLLKISSANISSSKVFFPLRIIDFYQEYFLQKQYCLHEELFKFSDCFILRYSRKLLWLDTSSTNNCPKIVASYFWNYDREIKGLFTHITFIVKAPYC